MGIGSERQMVTYRRDNGVGIITFDNPPVNAITPELMDELKKRLFEIKGDDFIKCLVFTGAGGRAFIAGADIKGFRDIFTPEPARRFIDNSHEVMDLIDYLPKPTIAAINGVAYGGGGELALACDIRIAGEDAKFAFPEVTLGIFPAGGGSQRLPRLIGESKAKEMLFTGHPITAQEALSIGLINKVAATGKALDVALELARTIAGWPACAVAAIKQAVDEGLEKSFAEATELEAQLFVEVVQTDDFKEGVDAFFDKRSPHYKHR